MFAFSSRFMTLGTWTVHSTTDCAFYSVSNPASSPSAWWVFITPIEDWCHQTWHLGKIFWTINDLRHPKMKRRNQQWNVIANKFLVTIRNHPGLPNSLETEREGSIIREGERKRRYCRKNRFAFIKFTAHAYYPCVRVAASTVYWCCAASRSTCRKALHHNYPAYSA